MALKNEPLAQIAPGSVELQLRLGDIRSNNPGRAIGQRLERKQDRGAGIARSALLAREIGQKQRLRRLRLLELAVSTFLLLLPRAFQLWSRCRARRAVSRH